ncbi:flavin reductase family protein [Novosphingobium pentaromativorans]|nr:flavin reductase family protein [Novosphingobium pentaromativorans]
MSDEGTRDTDLDRQAAIAAKLKLAMRRLPGPVSLITTCEPGGGEPAGMVASAVIPVSMEPPSMLVAINQSTATHGVVSRSQRFCINLLGTEQTNFVGLFANHTMRDRRFEGEQWGYAEGVPFLKGACSNIFCRVSEKLAFGTHELFVGEVEEVTGADTGQGEPLGWIEGDFARLGRLA